MFRRSWSVALHYSVHMMLVTLTLQSTVLVLSQMLTESELVWDKSTCLIHFSYFFFCNKHFIFAFRTLINTVFFMECGLNCCFKPRLFLSDVRRISFFHCVFLSLEVTEGINIRLYKLKMIHSICHYFVKFLKQFSFAPLLLSM